MEKETFNAYELAIKIVLADVQRQCEKINKIILVLGEKTKLKNAYISKKNAKKQNYTTHQKNIYPFPGINRNSVSD